MTLTLNLKSCEPEGQILSNNNIKKHIKPSIMARNSFFWILEDVISDRSAFCCSETAVALLRYLAWGSEATWKGEKSNKTLPNTKKTPYIGAFPFKTHLGAQRPHFGVEQPHMGARRANDFYLTLIGRSRGPNWILNTKKDHINWSLPMNKWSIMAQKTHRILHNGRKHIFLDIGRRNITQGLL